MNKTFNIYIDESCHLEHDDSNVMCIGYTVIDSEKYDVLKKNIKALKLKHKTPTEIKWNKLSNSRWQLYKELIDFFFFNQIEFRAILIKEKNNLKTNDFNRLDHNSHYYKTLSLLLRNKILNDYRSYNVYLDVKDTRGKQRIKYLKKELSLHYPSESPFKNFQHLHSSENEFLQLTDILIGAICYKARGLKDSSNASEIRLKIVDYLESFYGYVLDDGTEPWDTKFYIDDFRIKPSR